ncbi:ERF family protein [uncultured Clostridium sp.]|uniref:ERF family protein n=1 Tax=uncultured Clostridium sp. TaxID=59620 RepID=UPI00261172B5|nr:ERF family protein [uncultured Clostridium sp.]
MNVFEKLQSVRVKLQEREIKKSGKNKFSGYDYFELADILPAINELMNENKLCSYISYTTDVATLTIVNSEKVDEQIVFTSPMATAQLKGCHAIQNLGAVQSYLRRYLYLTAFEIVEADVLDATSGKEEESPKNNKMTIDKAKKIVIGFGGHKGKTMGQIYEEKPDYIEWLYNNTKDEIIRLAAKLILNK